MRRAAFGCLGRDAAQLGFFDFSDRYASSDAKKNPLVEIDVVVA
jgi:transposase, IS5 family